jgi:5-methyltetrahydrofolate--homocysteine methyltransferase
MVSEEFGLNLVLGASNVSFGLPGRPVINAAFMALAIAGGLSAAITNPTSMRAPIMATDLLLGRDARARRYVTYFRTLKKA